jgi:hypothetical protein
MLLTVSNESSVIDQGTVLVLEGTADDGTVYRFGADRRMAIMLLEAVHEEGEVLAEVEGWQLLGGGR